MTTEGDSETGGRVRVQETRGGSAGHKEGHGRESQSGELKMLKIRTIVVNGKGRQLDIDHFNTDDDDKYVPGRRRQTEGWHPDVR